MTKKEFRNSKPAGSRFQQESRISSQIKEGLDPRFHEDDRQGDRANFSEWRVDTKT